MTSAKAGPARRPTTRKSSFSDEGVEYSPKMLNMWANRYIAIAKASGNPEAKAWAKKYVPQSQLGALKKLIEQKLKVRKPDDTSPA